MLQKSHKYKQIRIWFVGLFLVFCSNVYSIQTVSQKYTGEDQVLGQKLTLSLPIPPQLDYNVDNSKLYIKISFAEIYKLGVDNPIKEFSLKLRVYENDLDKALLDGIVMSSENPEIIYAYNYSGAPDELETVSVLIEDIDWNDVSTSTNVQNYIKKNITVELTSEIDYRIDVRKQETTIAPIIEPFGDVEITNRYQEFSWETSEDFPNYQFELLRLYNTNEDLANKVKEIAATIDWSKALRIETQNSDKHIALTIAEGTGFYVWRVRPIGTFYEGGITDKRNWGEWSIAPEQGEEIANISLSDISAPYYFYFTDPDDDKNWIYSRTFSENNKMSEQISYANSLQQLRQSQTYLNSKDTSLITQTILDFSGRPSLTTIPVPVNGGLQPYMSNLVTYNDDLYTAEHFDKNDIIPAQVDSSGKYAYYSDYNENVNIPSSQGYPFTRVVYANDPTGRVIEQSGAGRVHAIGQQSDGMGRTTRTIYGNPSEEELIRIFGDEAPRADAVLKTTTIDPNNQASVTYTSKEGNVIATCLVVNENDNMLEIDGYDPEINNINSITTRNIFTGDQFVSSRKILLSKETEIQIQYDIECKVLEFDCMLAEGNCEYQVQFLIINLETNDVYESNIFDVCGLNGDEKIDDSDTWQWEKITVSDNRPTIEDFSNNKVILPEGKYMVKKIISVGATEETFQVETAFRESKLLIRPLINVIHNWLNNVSREEDMGNFYTIVGKLGSIIADPMLDSAEALAKAKIECVDPKLGGMYVPDEFVLRSTHSVFFDQEYIAETPTSEAQLPRMLTLTGGCCGDIKIPVIYTPPIKCYTVDEMRDDADMRPDFWNYFLKACYEPYKEVLNENNWYIVDDIPAEGYNLMQGYNENRLNTMIYYMLTDEYLTSPDDIEKAQYTCDKLWDAWQSVINSTNDILSSMANVGDTSVEGGAKTEDEESGTEGDSKDDHMNDDDNADMPGGFIMRWILKRSMADRVDDFENVGSDEGPTPVDIDFDIVGQFLQQVGYKFVAVVETLDDVMSEDKTGTKDPLGVNNILYDEIDEENENLPFIKNPVYAFKYFYIYTGITYPRYYQIEIQHCYNDPEVYADKIGTGQEICDYYCGENNYYDSWDYRKRYRFYKDVVNYKYPEVRPASDYLPENDDFDIALKAEAYAYFDTLKTCDICNNVEKIDAIRRKVEQTFIDNCYSIGGCPTDRDVVLPEDIDKIVAEIKKNCEDNCNSIFIGSESVNPDPIHPDYPEEVKKVCWALHENGTEFIEQSKNGEGKVTYIILPDYAWKKYLNLKQNEVVFALDDSHSLCECKDDFSDKILDSDWKILDNDVWETTDIYSYSSALNIDTRSNTDEYVSVWTNKIKGDFDVSVKVMYHESENGESRVGIIAAENMDNLSGTDDIMLTVSKNNKLEIKINGVAKALDGASEMEKEVTEISDSEYWIRLVKNIEDGKFYAFYKLNENDVWEDHPVNTVGIDGPNPESSNFNIGLYASGLKGADEVVGVGEDQVTIYNTGKAIFDDFKCGILYPNQIRNDEWIGGANHPDGEYYYPDVIED